MIPGLLITEGLKRGIYIQFPEGRPFWVGRTKDSDFVIDPDPMISAKHCLFLRRGSQLAMKDESTNGTRLNGRKVHHSRSLLKYADILRIGNTHFQVVDLDDTESQSKLFDFQACMEDLQKQEQFPDDNRHLRTIGPYLNIEVIGSGSFGTVYKAVHVRLQKLVALKVFTNLEELGSEFEGRFLREIELLRKLDHPSIIRLYDTGTLRLEKESRSYLALEYFQGVNLSDHLKAQGAIPWQKVLKILFQITKALDYMHHIGVLHRDLKPDNIMYNDFKGVAKIIDLGLGKCILDQERETLCITQPNSSMGTPNFMPIEQWGSAKEVDERADIYSLGATAYTLLSNHLPYGVHKDFTQLYRYVVEHKLIPLAQLCPAEVPPIVIKMVEKMMAFDANSRFSTSKKLLDHIQEVSHSFQVIL
jgi:serine/threonine protein kinase